MRKPSNKWFAFLAVAGVIAIAPSTYSAQANNIIYSDDNVSITTAVDRYIMMNSTDDLVAELGLVNEETEAEDKKFDDEDTSEEATTEEETTEEKEETTESTTEEETTEEQEEETTEAPQEEEEPEYTPVAPDYSEFADKAVVTAGSYINIREEANTSSRIVATIAPGGLMTVKEKGNTWSYVTSGGCTGYIKNEFLAFGTEAGKYVDANYTKVAVVNTSALRVRKAATETSTCLVVIYSGSQYTILSQGSEWTRIQVNSSVAGYVKNDYIVTTYNTPVAQAEPEEPEQTEDTTTEDTTTEDTTTEDTTTEDNTTDTYAKGKQIADFAVQYVGNPYVYGGTSLTNGADCSGFVFSVYKNFGYSLPRGATGQSGVGTSVSISELQPGDLVFYDHNTGSIEHVAIYIGNGQVVHASTPSSGIKISDLYYSDPFMAKRIVQ